MQLTIICPGIRTDNWPNLYGSIKKAFHGTWEIIFVGPYPLPESLQDIPNIKYIEDWGSPIRCQQIGFIAAQGDYINWAADDGEFIPYSLDIAYGKLALEHFDPKVLVMGKYREGSGDTDAMTNDEYYILSNHDASSTKFIKKGLFMLNVGMVPRETLLDLGGWDAENFEVCPMAYNDLAIRLQHARVKFIIQNELMFKCSHLPGHQGDHGPIHDGQVDHDQPRFLEIWNERSCYKRIRIDINNWEKAPARWQRRFGNAS